MRIIAARSIKEGEELTNNYLEGNRDYDGDLLGRRKFLKRKFGIADEGTCEEEDHFEGGTKSGNAVGAKNEKSEL